VLSLEGFKEMDTQADVAQSEQQEINMQVLLSRAAIASQEAQTICEEAETASWCAQQLCSESQRLRAERLL